MGCHKDLYYDLFYFLVNINDLEEGITRTILNFSNDTNPFRKTIRKLKINPNYKMTLIHYSGGLKNGRCYSILGNVNVCTQGMEILA